MKLFEIPVYALSYEQLEKRVNRKIKQMVEECLLKGCKEDEKTTAIDIATFPQRIWQYNHIVDYIQIYQKGQDIGVKAFIPYERIKRYHWNANKKRYLRDSMITNSHFRVTDESTSGEIQKSIHSYLDSISQVFIDKGYYIDREAFDMIDKVLDYRKLLNNTLSNNY